MLESTLTKMLQENDEVYVYNDWEDTAIKFVKTNGKTKAFFKPLGQNEQEVQYSEAQNYALGGRQMTKAQYERF